MHKCCSFKDKEVQRDAKMVSYDVVDKKGKPYVQVEVSGEKKTFSPEEISAMILSKMKETAGEHPLCFADGPVLAPYQHSFITTLSPAHQALRTYCQ